MIKWIKNSKGFTLIELMIVIAILGILAAFTVPTFLNVFNNRDTSNQIEVITQNQEQDMKSPVEKKEMNINEGDNKKL